MISAQKLVINIKSIHDARSEKHQAFESVLFQNLGALSFDT